MLPQAMPYNTRRVSLSLTSMGIHVPGSNQNRAQNRSPSTSTASTPHPTLTATSASAGQPPPHPPKRVKRSHTLSTDLSTSSTPSADPATAVSPPTALQRSAGPATGNTPPPSPNDPSHVKIDKDGINDDVVVGVLEQLEATGNRPHLIKELAVILTNSLKVVESSANPTAIISSRLTNYLRRPWTALAQCPLAKEQVTVHPRRVYYYLATCPHQDIPEYTDAIAAIPANGRIVSPSLSMDPDEDMQLADLLPPAPTVQEPEYRRDREAMSPSPELDDFDLPPHYTAVPVESEPYNTRGRVQSPPLEFDEREFSATACSMQALKRKQSEEAERQYQEYQSHNDGSASSSASSSHGGPGSGSGSPMDVTSALSGTFEKSPLEAAEPFPTLTYSDESEESAALANHETAAALFGQSTSNPSIHAAQSLGLSSHLASSPMLRPLTVSGRQLDPAAAGTPRKTPAFGPLVVCEDVSMADVLGGPGWEMRNPEAIGLQELDDLLGGF